MNAFRNDAKKTEIVGERETPNGRMLYLARPLRISDPNCLTCHTTPEKAPPSMVKLYGPSNGFGWQMNEVIGAQLVAVPTDVPFQMAAAARRALLISLVGAFLLTLAVLNLLLHISVIRPLKKLSRMADEVSLGNLDVPEVKVSGKDEVAVLSGSFNRMRQSLVKAMKMLEDDDA